jgi:hypothetical protein
MTERRIEFLVDLTGKSPRNLKDSIRRVLNASAGFRQSWLDEERSEAYETSQEAFEHFDYIQNELLRQRDVHKSNATIWPTSPFKTTLDAPVGRILNNISAADCSWFLSLTQGAGAMPATSLPISLTLDKALNKLKHRDTVAFNFSLPTGGGHILYMFTKAGMGQPDSLSEIVVSTFCSACKVAASHI